MKHRIWYNKIAFEQKCFKKCKNCEKSIVKCSKIRYTLIVVVINGLVAQLVRAHA